MIDISGRQSQETKLIDTLDNLKEAITATYQRKVHERVQGGVAGAGMMGSSFFDTLGLSGIAKNYKEKAEIKEKDRVEKESFVQDFQDNSEAGKVLSTSTARAVAEEMFKQKKQTDSTTTEDEIEANETREKQLEVQQKTSSDITDLYVITDDHFKKTDKYQKDSIKLLEAIAETGAGGGKGLLGTVADLAGSFGGRGGAGTAGKVGKLAGMAGKLGSVAKVGGGLLAVGTAAYDAYGDYSEADRKVQAGEITKQEGQVEKGKAVGGGIGAAGGALAGAKAGAALGTFLGPAGTVVGGLLGGAAGYIGGKWLGKKAGGGAVSGYQAVTGTGAPEAPAPVAQQMQPVATQSEQIDARKKIVEAKRESFKKPEPVVEQPKTVTPVTEAAVSPMANKTRMSASASQPASPALVSKAAPAPAAVAQAEPMVEKPVTADGETYDNRSALTGFTKEYLQGIVDGKISGAPISNKQAEDYLSKIQPGQAGYKKKMMRGRPVGEITPPTPLPAEPAPSGQAGDLSAKRSELMDAESAASSQATTNNTVVAPRTTNVINNSTTSGEPKSPRNSESTYQKYAERRFYPA
jgi:hypothetical protein